MVGDEGGYASGSSGLSSHNLAKLGFELAVAIPRTSLRAAYGAGFGGAPLSPRFALRGV
ncbi:MAG: hypothetical protein JWP08_506, partial [Bryobacterales bacterium]|nr:hypothetical protein [Bryobacterales bacterium]